MVQGIGILRFHRFKGPIVQGTIILGFQGFKDPMVQGTSILSSHIKSIELLVFSLTLLVPSHAYFVFFFFFFGSLDCYLRASQMNQFQHTYKLLWP